VNPQTDSAFIEDALAASHARVNTSVVELAQLLQAIVGVLARQVVEHVPEKGSLAALPWALPASLRRSP